MNPLTAKHGLFIINVGKSAAGFIFKRLNNIINATHQQKTNRMTTKQKLLSQHNQTAKYLLRQVCSACFTPLYLLHKDLLSVKNQTIKTENCSG